MKRNKLFSLLCVALGATTLLAGCGGEDSTKTGNFTDEDFVKMSYKVERTYYHEYGDTHTNLNLNKEYGEFVEENAGAILFRKTDKDFMNNVVDIYTLYNIVTTNKGVPLCIGTKGSSERKRKRMLRADAAFG